MNCPYCSKEGYFVDKYFGECSNIKCGGYFTLEPEWKLNKDWKGEEDEN